MIVQPAPQHWLLDTNVWTALVLDDRVEELARAVRTRPLTIVAAPSVAYELLRTKDPGLRRRLMKAITRGAWHRVPPEAYSACGDLFTAIVRLRPRWVRHNGDRRQLHALYADWMARGRSGFWARARRDPASEASRLAQLEGGSLDRARALSREARARVSNHVRFETVDLTSLPRVRFAGPVPRWRGDEVELWRVEAAAVYGEGLLARDDGPYVDWLGSVLDLRVMRADPGSWMHFWFYDVTSGDVPLEWLRSAAAYLQTD